MPEQAIVERNTTIRKNRRLPTTGEALVKLGEQVNEDTVIARGRVRNPEITEINVAEKLGVDAYNLSGYMLKKTGDAVAREEVIALRRTFFGKSTKVCRSPLDGTIEGLSTSFGTALVRGNPIPVEVRAFIPGRVTEMFAGEGAAVECMGAVVRGAIGIGGETHGRIEAAVESPDDALTGASLDATHKGKIVIGGAVATLDALRKAAQVGVSAIVVGGVDEKDLTELLGYELGFGVTGHERVGYTLIVTEGFGSNPMNEEIFRLLKENAGEHACVDGTTQIRTRMHRPEIIIPL
jgi:hypothetical protein